MKSTIFMGFALSLATVGLAACGGGGDEPAAEASPDGHPGITVSNGWISLPAVAGNPAAGYFDVSYDGDDVAVIRAASVEGASSTAMHSTKKMPDGTTSMNEVLQVRVGKGETVKFEPGGNHLMVTGLPDTVKPGDKVEITLTFVGGDKTSFEADVKAAGDAG